MIYMIPLLKIFTLKDPMPNCDRSNDWDWRPIIHSVIRYLYILLVLLVVPFRIDSSENNASLLFQSNSMPPKICKTQWMASSNLKQKNSIEDSFPRVLPKDDNFLIHFFIDEDCWGRQTWETERRRDRPTPFLRCWGCTYMSSMYKDFPCFL